jgi:hypothetical protein
MDLVKIVDMPMNSEGFKIVQLIHNSELVLLCGDKNNYKEHKHAKILKKYLDENKIEFETFTPDGSPSWYKIPVKEKAGVYKVVGMGCADINVAEKHFRLPYGASLDYEMAPDKEFNIKLTATISHIFENNK